MTSDQSMMLINLFVYFLVVIRFEFGHCGWVPVDMEDKRTLKVANGAVEYLSSIMNGDYQMKLIKINDGQVDRGKWSSDYKLNLKLGYTDCKKLDWSAVLENCPIVKTHVRNWIYKLLVMVLIF